VRVWIVETKEVAVTVGSRVLSRFNDIKLFSLSLTRVFFTGAWID
jgi:hypothetical protein